MTRLLKHMILFSGLAYFPGQSKAQDYQSLEARINSLETRLRAIETKTTVPAVPVPVLPDEGATAVVPEPVENETYVIREGDTIGGVARKFDVPRQALLQANNLTEGQPIYVGETLVIPKAPAVPNPGGLSGDPGPVHVVQPGDTLIGIARRYNVQVDGIKVANGLKSDVIGTGQRLVIPGGSGAHLAPQVPVNPATASEETYGKYTVVSGDNLYALARDFFTTLPELQKLNKLGSSTVIQPGQVLVVPTSKYNAYHKTASVN